MSAQRNLRRFNAVRSAAAGKRGEKGKAARFSRRLQGRKTELRKRQRRNSFEEEGTLMEGSYEPLSVPNTLYRG